MATHTVDPELLRAIEWTPRQREVLRLLTRGYTNAMIAEALGISLDGAKWHVSEIMGRLGVNTREEAAAAWADYNRLWARARRRLAALPFLPGAKLLAAGSVAVLAIVVAVVLVLVLRGQGSETPAASEAATPTPRGSATPAGSATAVPSASPTAPALARTVLSDGRSGYNYEPQLAYLKPDGSVERVAPDGGGRAGLLAGCTGMGSAKRGEVRTGGLAWSPEGGWLSCWNEDYSVFAAKADGSGRAEPFAASECAQPAGPAWAPGGELLECTGTDQSTTLRHSAGTGAVAFGNRGLDAVWAPSGLAVVAQGAGGVRVSYAIIDTSGKVVDSLGDAYVGSPQNLAWSRDGSRVAYPAVGGLTVVDLVRGPSAKLEVPWTQLKPVDGTSGPQVDWVLGDSALLIHNYSGVALVDAKTGQVRPVPGSALAPASQPFALGGVFIAPDGEHAWATVIAPDGTAWHAAFLDLQTMAVRDVANSRVVIQGIGPQPQATFSGDSKRACWTPDPGNQPHYFCAEVSGGGAVAVKAPVQVEPDVLGYGDMSYLWRAFSPDLEYVAYTVPGVDDPTAPQTLHVADLDGSHDVTIGPAGGAIPWAWRPDGVYRPARRF